MQNEETDFPPQEKHGMGSRRAKGCCLLAVTVILALFALALAAILSILIIDSVSLRGEEYTFHQRMKRYKVACQFIWADFKGWVSEKPGEPEAIQDPAELPPEDDPSY